MIFSILCIRLWRIQRLSSFPKVAAAAKLHQSCPILCDPIDGNPPGCPIPGILQARALEWVAISFSNAWRWKVKVKLLSRVRLLVTPWTADYQAPPSMGFSRQEYWSGVPLPSPFLKLSSSQVDGPTFTSQIRALFTLPQIQLIRAIYSPGFCSHFSLY